MSDINDRDRGLHRHDNPPQGEEQEAVTGRPNDTPLRGEETHAVPNSTLAERAKARTKAATKQVDAGQTEDKAVASSQTKSRTRK